MSNLLNILVVISGIGVGVGEIMGPADVRDGRAEVGVGIGAAVEGGGTKRKRCVHV